ncbi:helix-turn-helix transcriptional regulator [Leifsonia sp. RAF41]|uniref:helix-turn-helix transcriptional regulator n=1 Tax=Leifsonia sp. RAF41 TaxID=3233056 RepID=UPI003F996173
MSAPEDAGFSGVSASGAAIPMPLTAFIGRGDEVAMVSGLLSQRRLVTLTGPGGAGKTRLAAEVAHRRLSDFPDGVFWVDLSLPSDDASVAEAVAAAVGAPPVGDRLRSLCDLLASRRGLLCLDNAEHLLAGVADLVEVVLRACPDVVVLVTSREPLALSGEAVWPVPPLKDADAVDLFVDRARLVQREFELDESSARAVLSIAAHLDGVPLALELAAAWMRVLTPEQVEAGLEDRFSLLVRGPRGAPRRQMTLLGSIDWSYALLDDADRVIFRRLFVFAGSFTAAAAQAVCVDGEDVTSQDVLLAIGRLVDKSLLITETRDGRPRYRMLETIRAYATARAAESNEHEVIRTRHLGWCVGFAEAADRDRVSSPLTWRAEIALEYDNLVAGLQHGLAAFDPQPGRQLAASLAWYWHFDQRGREGMTFLRAAVERGPEDRTLLQVRLLIGLALVADTAGPLDVEYQAAVQALALAEEIGATAERAECLLLSAVGSFYVDFDKSWALSERARESALATRSAFVGGASRALQTMILHLRDEHTEAQAVAAVGMGKDLPHHPGIRSTLLAYQADGAFDTGDLPLAQELAEQAVLLAEPLNDYLRLGIARSTLARIVALRGDPALASDLLAPFARFADRDDVFIPGLNEAMALLATQRGDAESAVAWLERPATATERGAQTWISARALPQLGAALAALGRVDEASEVFVQAVHACRRLDLPGSLAQALSGQGDVAAEALATSGRAADLHHEALTIRCQHGLVPAQIASVEALARVSALTKPSADAVRLLAATSAARARLGLPRTPAQQASYVQTVSALQVVRDSAEGEDAASAGSAWDLSEAVAHARRTRGPRSRPTTGWASLTPTEMQVVTTIAEGLSNPDVGARLFMSRSTVKTHLGHIYRKLGVANRAELAARASKQDRGTQER